MQLEFLFQLSLFKTFAGYKKNRRSKTKKLTRSRPLAAINMHKKCVNKYAKKKKTALMPGTLSLRKESSWTKKLKLGAFVENEVFSPQWRWKCAYS